MSAPARADTPTDDALLALDAPVPRVDVPAAEPGPGEQAKGLGASMLPEPATASLIALGLGVFLVRRLDPQPAAVG